MTVLTRGQGVGLESPEETNDISTPHVATSQNSAVVTNSNVTNFNVTVYNPHVSNSIARTKSGTESRIECRDPSTCSCGSSNTFIFDKSISGSNDCQQEPIFPHNQLASLEDKINSTRWVIPVLPDQELEVLLDAAKEMCRTGEDMRSEACQRFFRDSMVICINKIMTDEAVGGWKYNIHQCIYNNCLRFIEICVLKLSDEWIPLFDLFAVVLNPYNKFHMVNSMRPSETILHGSVYADDYLYARPSVDSRQPKGWLVDMLNKFGEFGGFQKLLERFKSSRTLSVQVVFALIRPFGFCSDLLTVHTTVTYFLPIVEMIPSILRNLTDEELKREAKNESKNDVISTIIRSCRSLLSRVPNQEDKMKEFEMFRLQMLLRLLQISSFNGKMNALNEVNKLITGITYYPNRHASMDHESDEWLTSEKMAKWIKENNVLEIVLRDSLHQPQYVEKLEKILRFIIKEKALSLEDLNAVWAAQSGKHDAIVKNVHDLLAKLAWDFSPEQLDHLFSCFQASWTNANKKQTEKLLELIRRLAEDDKDGVMAQKVLTLFWNLAHKPDVVPEILDQALCAHVKILDYSCSQDRDSQKTFWIDKCVIELKNGTNWVIPALKLIKDICSLYELSHTQRQHVLYRQEIIERLQSQYQLVVLVIENLASYIESVRQVVKDHPDINPNSYLPDGKYNHLQQIQERLGFLKFLLKDGHLWLCNEQARQIWECLAEKNVFECDREACFRWFSKIMGDKPDLEPVIYKEFFENNILQFDPAQLTEGGMKCFERFFKIVNSKEVKIRSKRKDYQTEEMDLIGTDYLWRVLANGGDAIANRAIELLKEVNTNLGSRLHTSLGDFHDTHISECINRLRAHYDTISILCKQDNLCQMNDSAIKMQIRIESVKMCRVLKVLYEYINECDNNFNCERRLLPLYRASQGKYISLAVRFANTGRQPEDVDLIMHGNQTVGCFRRQILRKVKGFTANLKVELYLNGEMLDPMDDRRLISEIPVFKDKMFLTAKLVQGNGNIASSPDSSSDSSTESPRHGLDSSPNEDEMYLPGVIISKNEKYTHFFFQIADRGCDLGDSNLRDAARSILRIIPADHKTVEDIYFLLCNMEMDQEEISEVPTVDSLFFGLSPSQVLYNIEVLHTLLMPATVATNEKLIEFQYTFLCSEESHIALDMLTKNNFLPKSDVATKRAAFLTVLKICNVVLWVIGHIIHRMTESTRNVHLDANSQNEENFALNKQYANLIRDALFHLPTQNTDMTMRTAFANKVAQKFIEEISVNSRQGLTTSIVREALKCNIPHLDSIRAIMRLTWACAGGNMQLLVDSASTEALHKCLRDNEPDDSDVLVCQESLELLTISVILNSHALEMLQNDELWPHFIIDLVLLVDNRLIRHFAGEQIFFMMSFSHSRGPLINIVLLLFNVLKEDIVTENGANANEYFNLLRKLLSIMQQNSYLLQNIEMLLDSEIAWLKEVKESVKKYGVLLVDEILLEGHLGITKELLKFMSPEKKYYYGSDESCSFNLVKELIEDFIFPASKLMIHIEKANESVLEKAVPVCSSPQTLDTVFDLLVVLCIGCVQNLKLIVNMLCDMFYSERDNPLIEWDYLPPVGPRPMTGFVGLKNAGATCYMNSVLQQLYMIEKIKVNILAADGAATDPNEDFSGDDRFDLDSPVDVENDEKYSVEETRKKYNINILKEVQAIFGHLACSKLQYYVPKGLWRNFRLQGEPVNLREQQDAVEFFMSLIESIDEALKALNHEQTMSRILGGSFSDQKICKDCPHRYCREEPFSVISVDMRNHSTLLDSLEQYVKGELLEGADAYHCDRCSKKVVTVKRLCVKKLPPVLTIQLKRFEYDFERVCAIKFNDYFEFPRCLDMEPYTVSGLAKVEGELIGCDNVSPDGDSTENYIVAEEVCTRYQLTGVVVHSGQASGGHYYSYILHRQKNGYSKWYKFDDGDVSECKMDDDEEMKSQCFGGDYMGEVFDQMLKRMSYRRQKRWWNAYMLFYTRLDVQEDNLVNNMQHLSLADMKMRVLKMPEPIERSVIKQNIKFMHNRNQFSQEYFHFMKKLALCNSPQQSQYPFDALSLSNFEEMSLLTIKIVSKFLFHTGFHTKKALRGTASEWYEVMSYHLKTYRVVRRWFANTILLGHPHRFCEYMLMCPSNEVRTAFIKIVAHLAHFSLNDPDCNASATPTIFFDTNSPLSDQILITALQLLNKEISDHGRHLSHYFSLFHIYCGFGPAERAQLLRLNALSLFILVTLDEGPSPTIKYPCTELNKCHSVISTLVRSCDVRNYCTSSQGNKILPNPYAEPYIGEIQLQVHDFIYNRISYVKKLIEDTQLSDDTLKLLQFICWESPHMSKTVLAEVLWHIAYGYCNELKHHFELLLALLRIEDSWQHHRITNALLGISNEERDGLFDITNTSRAHYQKRSYLCIKCMVMLFSKCQLAHTILNNDPSMKKLWWQLTDWLNEELERRPFVSSPPYAYANWQSTNSIPSNDTTNGYLLERSNSARKTLEKALEICPDVEADGDELSDEGESSQTEEIIPNDIQTPGQAVAVTFHHRASGLAPESPKVWSIREGESLATPVSNFQHWTTEKKRRQQTSVNRQTSSEELPSSVNRAFVIEEDKGANAMPEVNIIDNTSSSTDVS